MRLLLLVAIASSLFAQPEIFILPPSSTTVTAAQQEPFTALATINTRNIPAFFFQNAEGTKYYSVGRTPTDTVVVLDAANPSVILARLNLSDTTVAVLSPDRRRLLVGGSAGLHIIDTATDTVVATIPGPAPVDLAVSLDGRRAYVLTGELTTINLLTNTPVNVIPIPKFATALAVNYTGLVYISAQDRLYEIADTGIPAIRRQFEIPGRPGRLTFTPDARTGLAINQTPETGFSVLRFDLFLGGFSGGIQDTGLKLNSLFLTDSNTGYAYSAQNRTGYRFTLSPLSFAESWAFTSSTVYTSISASSEFPRARNVYSSSPGGSEQFPYRSGVRASGRIVSSPPSFAGNPAHLYPYNGEQTSGALPLIVRVTDNVGRSLRDIRVQASNGESAISNADGWAFFNPPASFGSAITVTAGQAKAIFPLGSVRRPPSSIAILAGQGQMITPKPFDAVTAFRVGVRDAAGFPIVDTAVQFSISNGAGRLNCASSPICVLRSDARGEVELGFIPGDFPTAEYMQQQQVSVTAGDAPRRTIFVTTLSVNNLPSLQWIAPLQFSATGVVNSILSETIQVNTLITTVDDQRKVGQPVPNIALSIVPPLNFPDLSCDGEAGVVLTNASGRVTCPVLLGSRAGVVDLSRGIRMTGNWNARALRLTVEIAPTELPYLRVVRGRDQSLPQGGSSSPIAVRATDRLGLVIANQTVQWSVEPSAGLILQSADSVTGASGEAVASVIAGSTPGTYTVRALSNGLSAETRVYIVDNKPFISSSPILLPAEPGLVGVGFLPNPNDSGWAIQGVSSWIRTATSAGSGEALVWFTYDFNDSFTTSRTARFTIAGATVEFVQNPGTVPMMIWNSSPATSGPVGSFSVGIRTPHGSYTNVINLLIRDALDGRSACYLAYAAPSKQLYLVGDSGPETLLPPLLIPTSESVSNSQCTVLGTGSFSNLLSAFPFFGARISFAPTFGGSKIVYASFSDIFGRSSGWRIAGIHEVPGAPVTFPRSLGVAPAAISSSNAAPTFTFEDQTNAQNIETAWMLVNDALDSRGACSIAYHRPSNQLFLLPDSGLAAEATSMPLNGTGQLRNSQCEINAAGATASQIGTRLTVRLPIRFNQQWAIIESPKVVWTAVQTLSGQRSTWRALGVVR